MHNGFCSIHLSQPNKKFLYKSLTMSKLEVISNLYSNKESFCNGFLHKFHKSQYFFFYSMNNLKKQELHCLLIIWLALQGLAFGLPWFWTGLGVVAHSSHNTVTTTMPSIIQTLMHWMYLRWRSKMVMIWYFDNKTPLSINIFYIYFRWTIVEPGWCSSSFLSDSLFTADYSSLQKSDCQ